MLRVLRLLLTFWVLADLPLGPGASISLPTTP